MNETSTEPRSVVVEREIAHPPEKIWSAGTHLRMEQSGFRPDQKQAYGGAHAGWRGFLAKLEQVLVRID